MKKLITSTTKETWLSTIQEIELIALVNDARVQGLRYLPITAATDDFSEDYDQFNIEELMGLDDTDLRKIKSFYALDNIVTAIQDYGFNYKLTKSQKDVLSEYYKKRELAEVIPTKQDLQHLLQLLSECRHITLPDYRKGQPEKNFEELHNIELTKSDYKAIIRSIKEDEFIGALKSYETKRLGSVMYEFIHKPNNYKPILYPDRVLTEDMRIYIKILPDYQVNSHIAIISFHDALD